MAAGLLLSSFIFPLTPSVFAFVLGKFVVESIPLLEDHCCWVSPLNLFEEMSERGQGKPSGEILRSRLMLAGNQVVAVAVVVVRHGEEEEEEWRKVVQSKTVPFVVRD